MPAKSTRSANSSRRNAKPSISIVGPGRLGSALAVALHQAGFPITEIIARDPGRARALARRVGAQSISADKATFDAEIVWLTVADSAIGPVEEQLASSRETWRGRTVFHSSGALTSDELAALKRRGAAVASVHPLMTFRGGRPPALKNVFFGLEGDARAVRTAEQIVQALGGIAMRIRPEHKAAYHTWASFGSPMLIALLAAAEQAAELAGLESRQARKALVPLLQQTLDNYSNAGRASAFTGPLVRGDVGTVASHLDILRYNGAVRDAYVALAKVALESLPVGNEHELARLLKNVPKRKTRR